MELKAGYKDTYLGPIPDDWKVCELKELCRMKSGTAITASEISEEWLYPCYGGNGLRGYTSRYTHEGSFALIGRQGALCGNIVSAEGKFFASEHAVVVTPRRGVDIRFLTYLLREMRLNRWSESSAQPGLSVLKLSRLPAALPAAKAEQAAIGAVLGDADALIVALDRLIAKKHHLKEAAMQQLLTGQKRLPGFCRPWESGRLGELAEMASGGTPLSTFPGNYGGAIPWVSISDMTKAGKFIDRTDRTLTPQGLANSSARIFPSGTILYAMYASLGECSIARVSVCTSQAILGVQPRERLDPEFLYYRLLLIKRTVAGMGQHGTQSNLNKSMVEDFHIPLPSTDEQKAIAAVLHDMDAEIDALEVRRAKIRDVKQAMMQELLTGKTRLVTPEPVRA